jgi:ribosome modulation factor
MMERKRRRKRTPEERAVERAYQADLTRRLQDAIERYRKINEEKRRQAGESHA